MKTEENKMTHEIKILHFPSLIVGVAMTGISSAGAWNIVDPLGSERARVAPLTVTYEDVNHDGLKDIVIETKDKTTYIYLQQKDGTYKLQSQVEKEWRDEINR